MIAVIENANAWNALCKAYPSAGSFFVGHSARNGQDLPKLCDEPDRIGFAAIDGDTLTAFSVFRLYRDETMLEMSEWLSQSEAASREMLDCLQARYPAWQAEFTLRPREYALAPLLSEYGATVYTEQQNMRLAHAPAGIDTDGIEPLSEPHLAAYIALHENDPEAYWDGAAVAARPETFRVFLAIRDGRVIGYLDVTHCYETNNITDLYVDESERRKGYGAKLLAKTIEQNRPRGLTLQVDLDNAAAIRLYEKMGFETIPDRNSIDAIWNIK